MPEEHPGSDRWLEPPDPYFDPDLVREVSHHGLLSLRVEGESCWLIHNVTKERKKLAQCTDRALHYEGEFAYFRTAEGAKWVSQILETSLWEVRSTGKRFVVKRGASGEYLCLWLPEMQCPAPAAPGGAQRWQGAARAAQDSTSCSSYYDAVWSGFDPLGRWSHTQPSPAPAGFIGQCLPELPLQGDTEEIAPPTVFQALHAQIGRLEQQVQEVLEQVSRPGGRDAGANNAPTAGVCSRADVERLLAEATGQLRADLERLLAPGAACTGACSHADVAKLLAETTGQLHSRLEEKMASVQLELGAQIEALSTQWPRASFGYGTEEPRHNSTSRPNSYTTNKSDDKTVTWDFCDEAALDGESQVKPAGTMPQKIGCAARVPTEVLDAVHKTCTEIQDPEIEDTGNCSFVALRCFYTVGTVLILLNSVYMGVTAQVSMNALENRQEIPSWIDWGNVAFGSIFSIELIARMVIERQNFFYGEHRSWNLVDTLITVIDMFELLMYILFKERGLYLRMLKSLRAIRSVRLIRSFKMVRELRLMIASILCSVKSIFWAFVVVLLVVYIFALFIMQLASSSISNQEGLEYPEAVFRLYGDIGSSMVTLFAAISSGDDWRTLSKPLEALNPWYILIFLFYVTLVLVGILNVLTAIFVASAARVADYDHDAVVQDQIATEQRTIRKINKILNSADLDNSGTISPQELIAVVGCEEVVGYLKLLEWEEGELLDLYSYLDPGNHGDLNIDEFVGGMIRLKGGAKNMDVVSMRYETNRIHMKLMALMDFVETQANALAETIEEALAHRERRGGRSRFKSMNQCVRTIQTRR